MTTEILTSDTNNFYKIWQLIALMLMLITGCTPVVEKQKAAPEDEKVLSRGMAILADPEALDKSVALSAFEQACEMGNNSGCHKVGTAYNNGLYGKEKNYEKAKQWYEKAANKGYVPSQLNIANIYAHRLLPLDDETGFSWLVKAGDGLVKCSPGSFETKLDTPDAERQRMCRLAISYYRRILSIYRKRMTGEDMERIEKSILKNKLITTQDQLRVD